MSSEYLPGIHAIFEKTQQASRNSPFVWNQNVTDVIRRGLILNIFMLLLFDLKKVLFIENLWKIESIKAIWLEKIEKERIRIFKTETYFLKFLKTKFQRKIW